MDGVVDRIERQMVVAAPIERVWTAITSPDDLRSWFGDVADLDLRPGGRGRVGWTEFGNVTELIVETVEEPVRFAYRWSIQANSPFDPGLSTLVQFDLEDLGGSTRITMCESGFADLPDDLASGRLNENSAGWSHELDDLARHLARSDV